MILDYLTGISIIIASCVAIYGINAWKRELRWKRKLEIAEDSLSLIYEVQDALRSIRGPFGYANEGKSRPRSEDEDPKLSKQLDEMYVSFERYEKYTETFNRFRTLKYRFIAIFGKEYSTNFDGVQIILNKIFSAREMLYSQTYNDWPSESKISKEKWEKYHSIIFEDFSENDPISQEINRIISSFEDVCSKIIKKKHFA